MSERMDKQQVEVATPAWMLLIAMFGVFAIAIGMWLMLGWFAGALFSAAAFMLGVMVEAGRHP